jgi:hypothetical protein
MQNKYQRKRRQRNVRILSLIILLVIFVWLFASIISGVSPIKFAKDIFSRPPGASVTIEKMRKKELRNYSHLLLVRIDSMQTELDACQSQIMNRTATVNVDAETLNIRKDPSIDSEIVSKIPNGEKVDVIQIDQKTYFLDSKAGRWVQVSYNGDVGWVWGNYLQL